MVRSRGRPKYSAASAARGRGEEQALAPGRHRRPIAAAQFNGGQKVRRGVELDRELSVGRGSQLSQDHWDVRCVHVPNRAVTCMIPSPE